MTWLLLCYLALGYWYFRLTLRSLQAYDSATTAILNAGLALVVGPLLLALASPIMLFDALERRLP